VEAHRRARLRFFPRCTFRKADGARTIRFRFIEHCTGMGFDGISDPADAGCYTIKVSSACESGVASHLPPQFIWRQARVVTFPLLMHIFSGDGCERAHLFAADEL